MCNLCGPGRAEQVIDHAIDHPFELEPDTDMQCARCPKHLSAHPDKASYLRRLEDGQITEHGHMVRAIFPSHGEEGAPFAYTIGRTLKGRPEILITGPIHPSAMQSILNAAADLDDAGPLEVGKDYDKVIEGYKTRVIAVDDADDAKMFGATRRYEGVTAIQVLWPDADGRFPGDPGNAIGHLQPTYGGLS